MDVLLIKEGRVGVLFQIAGCMNLGYCRIWVLRMKWKFLELGFLLKTLCLLVDNAYYLEQELPTLLSPLSNLKYSKKIHQIALPLPGQKPNF